MDHFLPITNYQLPITNFEKTSLGWQFRQLRQQVGEWFELKTYQTLSDASLPSWLASPIVQTIARVASWVILGLLLTWATWQIWQLLRPYTLKARRRQSSAKATTTLASRLPAAGWLQRSQTFQQQGNYREACLYLYMAMLQRLNDTGIAPHQSSRTDGEYLQLVQQLPLPTPYQTLFMTHQQLCFSNAEASRSLFEQCLQAYREIEAL